jgi:acetolactate synthase small subunit
MIMRVIFRVALWMVATILRFCLKGRFVVMDVMSVLRDMHMCIQSTNNKLRKRVQRLQCVLDVTRAFLSDDEREEAELICDAAIEKAEQVVDAPAQEWTLERWEEIYSQDKSDIFLQGSIFDQWNGDPRQVLHDQAKKVVNNDGYVYDVFTDVSIVAYAVLYWMRWTIVSGYERKMVKESKLLFKGGAATGKFLIRNYRMTPGTLERVMCLFVRGGDNDTSLVLGKVPEMDLSEHLIGVQKVLRYYMDILEIVCRCFRVEQIIEPYADLVDGEEIIVENRRLVFKKSKLASFTIDQYATTPEGEILNKMNTYQDEKTSIYSTIFHMDFSVQNPDPRRRNFLLGRLKRAFVIEDFLQNRASVYAELLDVAVITRLYVADFDAGYVPM